MTAHSHTPGPWEIDADGDVAAAGEWVALVSTHLRPAKEHRANVRLIAAAPELLDALRNLLAAASMSAATGNPFSDNSPGIVEARHVIAKATQP